MIVPGIKGQAAHDDVRAPRTSNYVKTFTAEAGRVRLQIFCLLALWVVAPAEDGFALNPYRRNFSVSRLSGGRSSHDRNRKTRCLLSKNFCPYAAEVGTKTCST
jgi:hypothetical protein